MGIENMRVWSTAEGKDDPALFTPWSFVHVASGVALETVLRDRVQHYLAWAILLHTIYELKDVATPLIYPNSLVNSVGDTLSMLLGFGISRALRINVWLGLAVYASIYIYFCVNPGCG